MSPTGCVLVVDDNEDVLTAIRLLLHGHVEKVQTATSPAALPTLLREGAFDAVVLDMNFSRDASSGAEGLRYLQKILALDPGVAVLMITAYGDLDLAVRAMKHGAVDFITKPWDNARLLGAVQAAVQLRRTRTALPPPPPPTGFPDILGASPAMEGVFETIRKVAPTDANVLVLGENGTGKELVARALHRASARAEGPFVSADLGALSESLFESELFGHAKGAFTGAAADRAGRFEAAAGGTLFLDEIGNISPAQQARLLTVLQRREVTRVGETTPRPIDIRLVSATNQPLARRVREGAFRQDLLFRLNTVEIHLPPLRERGDDVALLAQHFLQLYAHRYGRPARRVGERALDKLRLYPWPGNVRELQHTMERAVIMAEGDTLEASDLQFSAGAAPEGDWAPEAASLDLEAVERAVIRKAMSKHGGNISRAAEELGLSRAALYRRIEKYGL